MSITGDFLGILDKSVWAILKGDPGFPEEADGALVIQVDDGSIRILPCKLAQAAEVFSQRFCRTVTYDEEAMEVS